jgi:hypothetical protein
MPSDRYGRSIRNVLLVIAFQLGLCIIVLAAVVNAARGYSTLLPTIMQFLGGVTAAGALFVLYIFEKAPPE